MSSGLRAPETQGGDHAPLSLATSKLSASVSDTETLRKKPIWLSRDDRRPQL